MHYYNTHLSKINNSFVQSNKFLNIYKLLLKNKLYNVKNHLLKIDYKILIYNNILLEKAIEQWGNLAALVSALYTNDYGLIGRSLVDVVVEPHRSALIPGFHDLKEAAIQTGALGSGISGSGPSMFALSKGKETAVLVGEAMSKSFESYSIEFELHISKINPEGIHIISSK